MLNNSARIPDSSYSGKSLGMNPKLMKTMK